MRTAQKMRSAHGNVSRITWIDMDGFVPEIWERTSQVRLVKTMEDFMQEVLTAAERMKL